MHTAMLLLLMTLSIFGQQTAVYQDPGARFRTGLELFENEKYGAAQKAFTEVIAWVHDRNSALRISARYYDAACAYELNNADAEYKLTAFIEEHPESASAQLAYFQLGKLQFRQANYVNALKSFGEVDLGSLSQSEKLELYFKKGFCYYKKKEYNRAKTEFNKLLGKESIYADEAIFYYAHIAYIERNYDKALEYFNKIEHIRSYSKLIPYYTAHIYHQKGENEKVIADATPLYSSGSNKNKDELALIIGDAHYQLGQYQEALPYLEVYGRTSKRSMNRESSYEVAYTYYQTGNYNDAINYFQQVTDKNDALAQNAYYHLGYSYLQTGQKKFASNAFSKASEYDYDRQVAEDALFNFAKLSMEVSQDPYNSAIENLEAYIQEYPNSPRVTEAYKYLSDLYLSTNNYREALSSIRQITNKNEELKLAYQKILFYRGVELFNQKEYSTAIELFKEAQRYDLDEMIDLESNHWIAEAFYRLGNYWGAIKYSKAFLSDTGARESELYPVTLYNLGYTYFKREDYGNAITYWGQLLNNRRNANPKIVNDALIRSGDAYLIRKDYSQAIRYYEGAIRMNELDTDYALSQKATAEGAQGQFQQKIKTLNTLINQYPSSRLTDDAKYEVAMTFLILNNNTQALTYFSKVIQEHPRSSYAVKSMLKSGLVYYDLNQYEQSIKTFKKVISKYPGTAESREALASLRNVYVDMNRVEEYYSYANNLGFANVSQTEQDSLTYIAAENIYMENRCPDAVVAFGSYINKFPRGYFAPNANYYMAECLLRSGDTLQAMEAYNRVLDLPDSRFTEEALLKASAMSYRIGKFENAFNQYLKLEELASDKNRLLTALIGQMQSSYLSGKYEQAVLAAQKVLQTETVSSESIIDAHFIMAKSYFALDKLNEAQREFSITEKLSNNITGAESKYQLAYLAFLMDKNIEAENLVFELVDKYAAYDYWIAKAFILLAEIYYNTGNVFQAKQTLQSVIDNYKGPELGEIAEQKLQAIIDEEKTAGEQETSEQ